MKVPADDSRETEHRKAVLEYGECRFGCDTPIPERHTHPVTELRFGVILQACQSHSTDEFRRCLERDRKNRLLISLAGLSMTVNPSLRCPVRIRVRNVLRGIGDLCVTSESLNLRSILEGKRAQQQSSR